jgi:hypothetical protein
MVIAQVFSFVDEDGQVPNIPVARNRVALLYLGAFAYISIRRFRDTYT